MSTYPYYARNYDTVRSRTWHLKDGDMTPYLANTPGTLCRVESEKRAVMLTERGDAVVTDSTRMVKIRNENSSNEAHKKWLSLDSPKHHQLTADRHDYNYMVVLMTEKGKMQRKHTLQDIARGSWATLYENPEIAVKADKGRHLRCKMVPNGIFNSRY